MNDHFSQPVDAALEAALRNAENLLGGVKMQYFLTVWVFAATTILLAWIAWRLH